MKIAPLTLLSAALLGLAQNAAAGDAGVASHLGLYINAGLGAVFSNTAASSVSDSNSILYSPTSIGTSLFSLPNTNWQNQFKNGYGLNLGLGKYFTQSLHGEFEFLYQNIRRDTYGTYDWLEQNSATGAVFSRQPNNPISTLSTRASLYSLLSNALYDFSNFKTIQPFLGAGVGISWLKSGSTQTNNVINIDDPTTPLIETAPAIQNSPSLNGTAFAWQVKAGINYAVSDTATAILQYRLFKTTDFRASQGTIITNPGTSGQSVFYTGEHSIKGILTQAVELNLRLDV